MIRLSGASFGFGVRSGVARIVAGPSCLGRVTEGESVALTLPFLVDAGDFDRAVATPGVRFFVIPLCSYYSHLAASLWSSDVPTIAVREPGRIVDGASVLADFDEGLLLVAETQGEADSLWRRASEFGRCVRSDRARADDVEGRQCEVTLLAEATTARELCRALEDGADGLSIVKVDHLARISDVAASEAGGLIRAAKDDPRCHPILVRFFDGLHPRGGAPDGTRVPQGYLGYRGVRTVEVDGALLEQFQLALNWLNLDDSVIVLPMVTSAIEVQRLRRRLGECGNRIGVTVETPAAALRIKELIEVSSFVEIGLNDLTQFTMAWDRDVPHEERLPDDRIVGPVADLVGSVAEVCAAAEVPYALGLDLRPTTSLASQIVGLGVTSISCPARLVAPWRRALRARP